MGKTTLAYHLGWGLHEFGHPVLLVDIDPQGNLTSLFEKQETCTAFEIFSKTPKLVWELAVGKSKETGISLVTSNIHLSTVETNTTLANYMRLKRALSSTEDQWDYVIIDCPPSLGIFTLNSFTASHYILIPTLPYHFSLIGLRDLMEVIESVKKDGINPGLHILGIVINQVDRTVVSRESVGMVEESFPELIFRAKIPKTIKIEEALQSEKPIWQYEPENPAGEAFKGLVEEFMEKAEAR